MIKKYIKKITIIALSLFCFTNTSYASSGFSVIYGNTGNENSSNDGPPHNTILLDTNEENTTYSCYFEYSLSRGNSVTIYGYNQDNDEIIEGVVKPNRPIPSGTSIGLNITETVGVKWGVDKVTLTKIETTEGYSRYKCHPEVDCPIRPGGAELMSNGVTPTRLIIDGKCYSSYYNYYSYKINDTCIYDPVSPKTNEYPITSGTKYNECIQKAEEYVKGKAKGYLGHSYNINLLDGNNGLLLQNSKDLISIKNKISGSEQQCTIPDNTPNTYKSNKQEIKCDYTYLVKNVCMNKITSKVTYRKDNCTSNEIKVPNDIKNGVEHWHYFIPLDTNTNGDGFSISMVYTSQSGIRSKEYCETMINNNSNYTEFIKDANYCQLTGNIYNDKLIVSGAKKTCSGTNKAIEGCYLGTDISIPVVQQFYGEEKKSGYTSLKGYGMYFRQIDINNPFPTDLANSIYWNGLYDKSQNQIKLKVATDSKPKTIKLETGFNNPTYVAKITNEAVNKIKVFNSKHSYTSWTGINESDTEGGMNANGKSNFVRKSGIITTKQSSFYKLGCGPTNANWVGCGNS